MTGRELLSRFRKTKVAKWCAVYLAATWVLLEVAAFVADWFDLPAVVVRVLTAVLATGFGVALVIAWYHGEKGRQSVSRNEALLLGILTVTAIAAGVLVARPAALAGTATKMALDPARVAVLYVEDFSAGRDLSYIADSFTESLTYELSQIDGLDVVSRTAVKAYRDPAIPVDRIALLLQAGTLVESSIEAIGDDLRVTVQLISGATGSHIASERITRSGTDLIRLREELVQKVVLLLRRQLGREIQLRDQRIGTQSGVAWSFYARAQSRVDESMSDGRSTAEMITGLQQAEEMYRRATSADPRWNEPLLGLAEVAYRRSRLESEGLASLQWCDHALESIQLVLARDSSNAQALALRGSVRYWQYLLRPAVDSAANAHLLERALADLQRAVALNPRSASAWGALSHLLVSNGDIEGAAHAAEQALQVDPYFALERAGNLELVLWRLTTLSFRLERFDESRRWCDEGRKWYPEDYRFTLCRLLLGVADLSEPDIDQAWQDLAMVDSLVPHALRTREHLLNEAAVGAVIARAASMPGAPAMLTDSARHVLGHALADCEAHDASDETHLWIAYGLILLGDTKAGVGVLRRVAVAAPAPLDLDHWMWRAVRGDRGFQALRFVHASGTN